MIDYIFKESMKMETKEGMLKKKECEGRRLGAWPSAMAWYLRSDTQVKPTFKPRF